jgi:RNA polymerase sigma-70 factor (ECF subfamily)
MGIEHDSRDSSARGRARSSRGGLAVLETTRPAPALRRARASAERDIQSALEAGAAAAAAANALRAYDAEVFGFLLGALESPAIARDVYVRVSHRVEKEIERFAWRCSLRTWIYTIARHEIRYQRGRSTEPDRGAAPLSVALPDPVTTAPFRRVGIRAAIAALRSGLSLEDREILILRIDRRFEWRDLALTSLGAGASPQDILCESARLRARLEQIRGELARAAIDQKILAPRTAVKP